MGLERRLTVGKDWLIDDQYTRKISVFHFFDAAVSANLSAIYKGCLFRKKLPFILLALFLPSVLADGFERFRGF